MVFDAKGEEVIHKDSKIEIGWQTNEIVMEGDQLKFEEHK